MAHRVCCDDFRRMDRVCCDEPAHQTVSAVMQDRVCCDDFGSGSHRKSLRPNEIAISNRSLLEDILEDKNKRRQRVRKKTRFARSRSFGSVTMEVIQ